MSTNQRQTMRLRKKIVAADESDVNKLNTRMTAHLRASKLSCSTELISGRESEGEAEYVEDGSVAMRSGTAQHPRDRPMFGLGFRPKETDYLSGLEPSGAFSSPNRLSKDTNLFYKKAKQNSSELAKPRRLPTAYFGLVQDQETESYATQVVDSHLEVGVRGAQATREMKRKLNQLLRNVKLRRHERHHLKA